jgi:hypothetical protein
VWVLQTVWSEIRACRGRRSFGWRGINHELEALLRRRKLGDIMLWVSSSYMLLHRPVSLFLPPRIPVTTIERRKGRKASKGVQRTQQSRDTHAEATFATTGAILIPQWTHNLVVRIRDGEGRRQRGSRRHRQCRPHHAQARGRLDRRYRNRTAGQLMAIAISIAELRMFLERWARSLSEVQQDGTIVGRRCVGASIGIELFPALRTHTIGV